MLLDCYDRLSEYNDVVVILQDGSIRVFDTSRGTADVSSYLAVADKTRNLLGVFLNSLNMEGEYFGFPYKINWGNLLPYPCGKILKSRLADSINNVLFIRLTYSNYSVDVVRCVEEGLFLVYASDSSGCCRKYSASELSLELRKMLKNCYAEVVSVSGKAHKFTYK